MLRHAQRRVLRATFSASAKNADRGLAKSFPARPQAFPRLQAAWREVAALPEVESAKTSGTPALAGAELGRARAILVEAGAGSARIAVATHLEAVNLHRRGLLTSELRARSSLIDALGGENAEETLGDEQLPLFSGAATARAVAALRGAEVEIAASAAQAAQATASCAHTRLVAELCAAVALPPGDSEAARARLSAIVALAPSPTDSSQPDVGGLARVLGAQRASPNNIVDELQGLVVRWDSDRPSSFDYTEALVAYGRALTAKANQCDDKETRKKLESQAEDVLSKALAVTGAIGNELDKAEPLLAVAELYVRQGNIVEAEGLYRSVEERFRPAIKRDALSVSAAGVYVRGMASYAEFLENCEFAGRKRTSEAEFVRAKHQAMRDTFTEILSAPSLAPLWVVDSLLPSVELPLDCD